MTGERAFDLGTGASIYSNTDTGVATGASWKYLGILTNEKPSAVFRLGGLFSQTPSKNQFTSIEIGISIESSSTLEHISIEAPAKALVPLAPTTPFNNPLELAQRIGELIFDYLMSYAKSATSIAQVDPSAEVVPIRMLQEWYYNLQKRANNDPEGFVRQVLSKTQ